jgi:hypothetical protein
MTRDSWHPTRLGILIHRVGLERTRSSERVAEFLARTGPRTARWACSLMLETVLLVYSAPSSGSSGERTSWGGRPSGYSRRTRSRQESAMLRCSRLLSS